MRITGEIYYSYSLYYKFIYFYQKKFILIIFQKYFFIIKLNLWLKKN